MTSVKFDNVEIQTTTYVPRFVQHESVADRNVFMFPIARENGQILVTELYGKKIIRMQGMLVGSSSADLDSKIDAFKELFSRAEKNLDISWNNTTRRYIATCTTHEFQRDYYNLSMVPWVAEFTVASGIGTDTGATNALAQHTIITASGLISNFDYTYDDQATFEGSTPPRPTITLEVTTADTTMKGIEYTNLDTGERLLITRNSDWSTLSGKQIIINCSGVRVTDNFAGGGQVEGKFFGTLPHFKSGVNNVRIRTGGFVNQGTSDSADTSIPDNEATSLLGSSNTYFAQSFQVPYTDDTFGAVTIAPTRYGSPSFNLFWRVVGDKNGFPDYGGTTVASGTFDANQVPTSPARGFVTSWGGGASTMEANTTYWLVVGNQGVPDVANLYGVRTGIATYAGGTFMTNTNSGLDGFWQPVGGAMSFRIMTGGQGKATTLKHTIDYIKRWL